MKIIEITEQSVDVEDYKELSVMFTVYSDFLCYNHWIWVEDEDFWGKEFGWWLLGVGLDFPPWNINDNIKGNFN
jgi:hypothetical protein